MGHPISLMKGLLAAIRGGRRSARHRRPHQVALGVDGCEARVVLSHFGFGGGGRGMMMRAPMEDVSTQSSSLSADTGTESGRALFGEGSGRRGPGGGEGFGRRGGGGFGGGSSRFGDEQLATDLEQLRTDLNAVLAGSTVTDAMRLALRTDLRAIAEADVNIDKTSLAAVVDDLLTALADDSFTDEERSAVRASFNALFEGSTVEQTLIDQTFADLVTVADNLNIDTTELAALEADRAAIAADYERLGVEGRVSSNLDLIITPGDSGGRRGPGGRRGGGNGKSSGNGGDALGDSQLRANLAQYRADVAAATQDSAVTRSQRTALRADLEAIAEADVTLDKAALAAVVDSLLTAVADDTLGADEGATIQASFAALFEGSAVEQALIDETFADLVTVANSLNIDADELTTIVADRAAIAADLERLGIDGRVPTSLDLIFSQRGSRSRRGHR